MDHVNCKDLFAYYYTIGIYINENYGIGCLYSIGFSQSISAALDIRKSFNESTPKSTHCKPISTIIYTHFHPDHTNGGAAFIDNASNPPNIYAHPYALEELTRIFSIAASVNNIRSMRQFGTLLNEIDKLNPNKNLFENSGIGPFLKFGDQYEGFITMPNKLLNQDFTQLIIDNIQLDIYFAPGETRDQIFIYLPQKRVLLPADNIYEAFPNIYAIRGSPTRDARKWVYSLDKMRAIKPPPLYLIPCHTRPVFGEENISNLLRDYRDGISLVHDQTVRFLNKGLYPEQIIPLIHMNMPKRLKEHPYLQEFYGTIDWSVRGIFDSYLGWFSGDAADLYPLSKIKSAKYLLELFDNDYNKLLLIANKYIIQNNGNRDSCQYGLDISTKIYYYYRYKMKMKKKNSNIDFKNIILKAKKIRIDGLNCMASFMISANGRNYYLTQAIEEELPDASLLPSRKRVDWAIQRVPIDQMMSMSSVRLKIEEMNSKWKNIKICYDFYDKWYQFIVRDGIAEVKRGYSDELKTKMDIENNNLDNIENIVMNIMVDYAYIVFDVTRQECHDESDFVMQCSEQDFRDSISEYNTSSAVLYAKGKINMIRGTVLDMSMWKNMLELQ